MFETEKSSKRLSKYKSIAALSSIMITKAQENNSLVYCKGPEMHNNYQLLILTVKYLVFILKLNK